MGTHGCWMIADVPSTKYQWLIMLISKILEIYIMRLGIVRSTLSPSSYLEIIIFGELYLGAFLVTSDLAIYT